MKSYAIEKGSCEAKKENSMIVKGMQIYHNFMRPHMALGKTPAEASGIKVEGLNKWKTIIANARLAQKRQSL